MLAMAQALRQGRGVMVNQAQSKLPSARKMRRRNSEIKTFADYQEVVGRTDERRSRAVSLMGLVGEIGDLHSMMKKILLQRENRTLRDDLREEFGDVLWYLTSLSNLYGISLTEIAQANADKALAYFSEGEKPRFDTAFPPDERLPRLFVVTFYEKPLERGVHVKISVNDVVVGDALTDNAHEDDGYRYHDVFHLAYAAVLGWSPVARALLKCKRKSKSKVDEVEDGARAMIIEEAVSILIFNQAEDRGWYRESSAIDIGLLKTIRRMVAGLEVRACTAKQWKKAILQGYEIFDHLKINHGGEVIVDLDNQQISFRKLKGRTGAVSIRRKR